MVSGGGNRNDFVIFALTLFCHFMSNACQCCSGVNKATAIALKRLKSTHSLEL